MLVWLPPGNHLHSIQTVGMPYVSTYPVLHPQNFVGRNRTVRNVVKQIEDFFVNFQKSAMSRSR